jgi:hypothetical protein
VPPVSLVELVLIVASKSGPTIGLASLRECASVSADRESHRARRSLMGRLTSMVSQHAEVGEGADKRQGSDGRERADGSGWQAEQVGVTWPPFGRARWVGRPAGGWQS